MKRKAFLQWWLIFSLIVAGSVLAYITGLISIINTADFTKISFLIYTLFIVFSIKCGFNTAKNREDTSGWFVSDILVKLGLIGTLIGLIYVFTTSLGSIDVSQPQTMKAAISSMMTGMGTALYTTIIGLSCSLILQLQLHNLEKTIEDDTSQ